MAETKKLDPANNAHQYPLLIKQLLLSGPRYNPDQEIIYANHSRYTYTDLVDRIHRLAHALTNAGVKPGDTVAVLDWDTPRYLECFFAVPMIGAVLHTVNVRLSPDQVLYTMNHAEDDLVLIHDDFLPLMEQINDQLETVTGFIQLTDDKRPKSTLPEEPWRVRGAAEKGGQLFRFPGLRREQHRHHLLYTTGTTGNPKGVFFSHRQLVLHTLSMTGTLSHFDEVPLIRSNSVYMPFTPMFHVHAWGVPYAATMMGVKQVYPGRYEPEALVDLLKTHKVTFSHCVPTIMQMLMATEGIKTADLSNWHVLIGGSALPKGPVRRGGEAGHAHVHRLRHVRDRTIAHRNTPQAGDLELPSEQQTAKRIKTGVAVPMVDVQIVDEDGNQLPGTEKPRAKWSPAHPG